MCSVIIHIRYVESADFLKLTFLTKKCVAYVLNPLSFCVFNYTDLYVNAFVGYVT